jgi:sugar lactone lactonase YvrE
VTGPAASLLRGAVTAGVRCELGEGPVWDAARGELLWVDIDSGVVHRRSAGGELSSFGAGQPVGSVAPRAGGGLVLALRDGFALTDAGDDRPPRVVAPVEAHRPYTRMNDGACDSRGRFWAGTMALAGDTRAAALYRLDPDLSVARVLPGISTSNGIGWSPAGDLLYHVDTWRARIDVYEFDAERGAVAGRAAVIHVPGDHGRPDGLAVDAEGGIWLALWGGGAVQRYTAAGELDARLELPATNVTSCCFGDADLGTLYVTTAARGAPDEPLAGRVFAHRPGVAGLPATPFGG